MEIIKYKSGSIRYREKIFINGKEIKGPCFVRKTDAKNWKANMQVEKSKNASNLATFQENSNMTFEAFASAFLENKVLSQLSLKTYQGYKSRIITHLYPLVGDTLLKKISSAHLNLLIQKLRKNGHNSTGINIIIRTFKRVMSEAFQEGFILKNPLSHSKNLKEDLRQNTFMSKEEISQLIASNRDHEVIDVIIFALNTGMRRGEIAGLCWDMVNLDAKLIEVSRTRDQNGTNNTTKTGERRFVPMNQIVYQLLKRLNESKRSEFVFVVESGKPFNVHHIYRIFNRMQVAAGFKKFYRFHDLRHTFASHFMMNGGNLYDLQKILGHSKSEMTNRYAHLSNQHLSNIIDIVQFE